MKSILIVLCLFFFTPLISYANSLQPLASAEQNECPAPGNSTASNITLWGFDLSWDMVPFAIDYEVTAFANGIPFFNTITSNTSIYVASPSPFQEGDSISYEIYTICSDGVSSDAEQSYFHIIATVDVVMLNQGDMNCIACPNISIPQSGDRLFPIYDCECVKNNGRDACKPNRAALFVSLCTANSSIAYSYGVSGQFSPNPFVEKTVFTIDIYEQTTAHLDIFNFSGRKVASLLDNEIIERGAFTIPLDGYVLEKGIYFYRFSYGDRVLTGKVIKIE